MDSEEPVSGRVFESDYMLWAKTQSRARFNLATSGVPGFPLADLGVSMEELEINGPGGYGYGPLREAIGHEYGVPAECIVAGGGASGANQYAFLLLLGPGDEALVEFPAYDILPNLARFTGAKITRFVRRPENGWAVDPEEIARLMTPRTKLVVLTNLHNPSSALMDEATLSRIGDMAARNGAHVLVDEVYLDCIWENRPRSAYHLGPNFLVTSSLTKVYGLSGLRCGWIFAPAPIAERLWRLIDLFDNIPSHPSELLSTAAFRRLPEIRNRSRQWIETNRGIYQGFAAPRGFEVPAHGTVAFPRVMNGPATGFCELLREKYETTVVPGEFFGMPAHVRISLVTSHDVLREGLARLEAALDCVANTH
ncbi:MAG: pyridoxal phosphate-dependent aminotransferase [Acidobacteriota bacterium]